MPRTNPPYPPEFRAEAIKLARSSEKPLSEAACDLGIATKTLKNCLKQQDIDTGKREGTTTDEREELKRLRRENKILKEEREYCARRRLFRQRGVEQPEAAMIFSFVETQKDEHPVGLMCRVLKVSRSGYYAFRVRPSCRRERDDAALKARIERIHRDSRGTYGAPQVTTQLRVEGVRVGNKRVARLMRRQDLESAQYTSVAFGQRLTEASAVPS